MWSSLFMYRKYRLERKRTRFWTSTDFSIRSLYWSHPLSAILTESGLIYTFCRAWRACLSFNFYIFSRDIYVTVPVPMNSNLSSLCTFFVSRNLATARSDFKPMPSKYNYLSKPRFHVLHHVKSRALWITRLVRLHFIIGNHNTFRSPLNSKEDLTSQIHRYFRVISPITVINNTHKMFIQKGRNRNSFTAVRYYKNILSYNWRMF